MAGRGSGETFHRGTSSAACNDLKRFNSGLESSYYVGLGAVRRIGVIATIILATTETGQNVVGFILAFLVFDVLDKEEVVETQAPTVARVVVAPSLAPQFTPSTLVFPTRDPQGSPSSTPPPTKPAPLSAKESSATLPKNPRLPLRLMSFCQPLYHHPMQWQWPWRDNRWTVRVVEVLVL